MSRTATLAPTTTAVIALIIGGSELIGCSGAESAPATSGEVASGADGIGGATDAEGPGPRAAIGFQEVTALLAGVSYSTLGVSFVDFDDDGWPDITLGTERGVKLLRNRGGTFRDVTGDAHIPELNIGEVQGVVWGDLDGDGDLDLFLSRFASPDALLINDGGIFHDGSKAWGLPTVASGSHSASLGDLDGDLDLDVFVATGQLGLAGDPGAHSTNHPDRVYRNDAGRFTEAAAEMGLQGPNGGGDSFVGLLVDFDADGDIDVLSIHDLLADHLFQNDGKGHFTDQSGTWLTTATTGLMGLDVADVDGDGLLDVYGTNFGADVLYLQRPAQQPRLADAFGALLGGAGDPTDPVTGWGCALVDVDDDGDVDVLNVSASDRMFLPPEQQDTPREGRLILLENRSGASLGPLVDVSDAAGDPFGLTINGYGLATGDFDRDGAVDVVLGAQQSSRFGAGTVMHPMLLRNVGGGALRRLSVRLSDPTSPNTHAVGARVDVIAGGRRQVRVVTAGASFLSSHDYALHFGLGDGSADAIAVTWPGGEREEHVGPFLGEFIIVRGGPPQSFDLPRP